MGSHSVEYHAKGKVDHNTAPVASLPGVKTQNQCSSSVDQRSGDISFTVLSWNAVGISSDGFENMLDRLESFGGHWDVLVIQEGPKEIGYRIEEVKSGHLWHVAPAGDYFRSVGILLHRRWSIGSDTHNTAHL